MGEYERVLPGTRSQVFVAAYQAVIARHQLVTKLDPKRATFSFYTLPTLWSDGHDVTVAVETVDDTRVVVFVDARDASRFGWGRFDFGTARRIAEWVFRDTEAEWTRPLVAFGEPAWYYDPVGHGTARYWDGATWTAWVWGGDQLGLDHPAAPKWRSRRDEFLPGIPVVWMRSRREGWIAPPVVPPHVLRDRRGRLIVYTRYGAALVASAVVFATAVWLRVTLI